jgi:hypothetical protein
MPTTDNIRDYHEADRYWDLVKRTLENVLHEHPDPAQHLSREISTWPEQERLLFYHAEPLDVAADLAGRQPTADEVKAYRRLADQVGWGAP